MKVSIVVPVHNEASTIGKTIQEIWSMIRKNLRYDFEVIVIDNNSTDESAAIARSMGVRLIKEQKVGKGNALKKGFYSSSGDVIVMLDGDYSHKPEDIPKLLREIENGAGLVIACRSGGHSEEYTMVRGFGNRFLTFAFNLAFNRRFNDVLNGFKAFKRRIIERKLSGGHFEIEIELVANAIALGEKVVEVPSMERKRAAGKMKSRVVVDGFRFLFKIISERMKMGKRIKKKYL